MSIITKSVDLDLPVSTVYDEYTRFERWPVFMAGVVDVEQLDDAHVRWTIDVGGQTRRFTAEITDQIPDELIAWRSLDDPPQRGIALFEASEPGVTRLTVQLEYEPEGLVERLGEVFGAVDRRLAGDLERFCEHLRTPGDEGGGWRGTIIDGERIDTPLGVS